MRAAPAASPAKSDRQKPARQRAQAALAAAATGRARGGTGVSPICCPAVGRARACAPVAKAPGEGAAATGRREIGPRARQDAGEPGQRGPALDIVAALRPSGRGLTPFLVDRFVGQVPVWQAKTSWLQWPRGTVGIAEARGLRRWQAVSSGARLAGTGAVSVGDTGATVPFDRRDADLAPGRAAHPATRSAGRVHRARPPRTAAAEDERRAVGARIDERVRGAGEGEGRCRCQRAEQLDRGSWVAQMWVGHSFSEPYGRARSLRQRQVVPEEATPAHTVEP